MYSIKIFKPVMFISIIILHFNVYRYKCQTRYIYLHYNIIFHVYQYRFKTSYFPLYYNLIFLYYDSLVIANGKISVHLNLRLHVSCLKYKNYHFNQFIFKHLEHFKIHFCKTKCCTKWQICTSTSALSILKINQLFTSER